MYTSLLAFPTLEIVDNNKAGTLFFGRRVLSVEDICWEEIDCLVISSFKYQEEIASQIKKITPFNGELFTLYSKEDKSEFYHWNDSDPTVLKWYGEYATWEEAANDTEGYDDQDILTKVYKSTKETVETGFGFERDSVRFNYNEYSYLLLTFIAFCAVDKKLVRVADFGGSLGSLYWKNRNLLWEMDSVEIEWNVIEQKHFVDCGRKSFGYVRGINYYYSLSELKESPDIILFSGVLQFVEDYWKIIKFALELEPKYIIVDRAYFMQHEALYIQKVPESICKSSYPIRFFDKEKFAAQFYGKYILLVDGTVEGVRNDFYADGNECFEGFMVFKRKDG